MTRKPDRSVSHAHSGRRATIRRGEALTVWLSLTKRDATDLARPLVGKATPEQVEDLRFRVSIAAFHYRQRIAGKEMPSPSAIRKQMEAIKRPAQKILSRLGATEHPTTDPAGALMHALQLALLPAGNRHARAKGGYTELPPRTATIPGVEGEYWDYRAAEKLASIVDGVQTLVAWCDEAIAFSRNETIKATGRRGALRGRTGKQARHEGDLAVNEVIFHLAGLYRDLTGREPGIARPPGKGGDLDSPFIRFVLMVCARLQIPMTAASFEKRWRTVGRLGHASDHARNKLDPTNSP